MALKQALQVFERSPMYLQYDDSGCVARLNQYGMLTSYLVGQPLPEEADAESTCVDTRHAPPVPRQANGAKHGTGASPEGKPRRSFDLPREIKARMGERRPKAAPVLNA